MVIILVSNGNLELVWGNKIKYSHKAFIQLIHIHQLHHHILVY